MVGTERLELSHLAALEPKSSASTNFATSPTRVLTMSDFNLFKNLFILQLNKLSGGDGETRTLTPRGAGT